MVAAVLDALVGEEPRDEVVLAALATIPAAELPDALRLLARQHGLDALPVLRRCLAGRPDWAIAAADALATLRVPEAAEALAAAEATASGKAVRTALRRARYRLRQAGVALAPPQAAPRPAPARPTPHRAWMSTPDGTGSRGLWLVLEGAFGERTLLSAVLNDVAGVLDFSAGPIAKKRLDERLRTLHAEAVLPWVEVPPTWAWACLVEAGRPRDEPGGMRPGELARWLALLGEPRPPAAPPIHARIPPVAVVEDLTLLPRSAELLALPDLAGWFLDPATVHADALDLLQAKESRLVVSDQIKAERVAAILDRVIDAQFTPELRGRWQRRLEDAAWILLETGRPGEARLAVATAYALADPDRTARHLPFVRALVERSLEVAGEVALGRLSAEEVSRQPRRPRRPH